MEQGNTPATGNTKILYVEDEIANKVLVRKLLLNAGYQVVEANDGMSGIEVARKELPNLILMDMNMPGLDGYEAATRIKSIANLSKIPVIALTANAMGGDRERSLAAGCNGYISKPVNIDSFIATVESYLQGASESLAESQKGEYLEAYNAKLVERLDDKVRELTELNAQLEDRVNAKINELKSAQEQLLQSEKLASIGQLAAGVAHEINNPVGYISSNIGALKTYMDDLFALLDAYAHAESDISSAEKKQMIEKAREAASIEFLRDDISDLISESQEGVSRVKKIVQDLKDFSHQEEAEWQWSDLHRGMESTLNIVSNEIKYKANVIKEFGEIPEVECIISQLNQIFMNLLVNAAHAIEDRGTITIRTGTLDEEVWVEIEDDGKGMDEATQKKIFDPFFTTKPIGKGTGLGLSLSYGIVQKHAGRIEVDSEVGRGTCFRITLPVKQKELKTEDY